jgi:hypothetical protein
VERQLANLRPEFYASAFRAWRDAEEGQNQGFLLRGQALEEAEVWARGKRLSDADEKFFGESREMKYLINQQALEIEIKARQNAEQQARKILAKAWWQAVFIITIASIIMSGITLFFTKKTEAQREETMRLKKESENTKLVMETLRTKPEFRQSIEILERELQQEPKAIKILQLKLELESKANPTKLNQSSKPDDKERITKEALTTIKKWLDAKQQIFGLSNLTSKRKRELANKFTAGSLNLDIIKQGGSISWLENNNAYYEYENVSIKEVIETNIFPDEVHVTLKLQETLSLYVDGEFKLESSGTEIKKIKYFLVRSDDNWKIYDHISIK